MLEKTPSRYVHKNHLESLIIGDKESIIQTRRTYVRSSSQIALLSIIEHQNVNEARKYQCWVKEIHQELHQIEKNHTWELIPCLILKM